MTRRTATAVAGAAFAAGAAAMLGIIGWAIGRSDCDDTNCK